MENKKKKELDTFNWLNHPGTSFLLDFLVFSLVIALGITINILIYNNLVHVNSNLIWTLYKTLLLYNSTHLLLGGVISIRVSFYACVKVMLEQIQAP